MHVFIHAYGLKVLNVGGGAACSVAFDAPKERHRASDGKKIKRKSTVLLALSPTKCFACLLAPFFHYSFLIHNSFSCCMAYCSCLFSFLGVSPGCKYPFQLIAVAVILFCFVVLF